MANRLAGETSPYLLQHANNPVDWYPWGDDAFAAARERGCPVLLSVGYSACHWCHVMAHESFEDATTAALMNELFVNIKVDREERPDVDAIYMQAVQALTGSGGWPMTVFLTPDGTPFYGGTYFPPAPRHGMPAFAQVLEAIAEAYRTQRDVVDSTGVQLRRVMAPPGLPSPSEPVGLDQLDEAAHRLLEQVDRAEGGFGGAPKFPHSAALDLLLRRRRHTGDEQAWSAATLSLDHMARGGMHDQLAGGFHRYSVDARWAVPHFEKMLYDNAQLAPVYLHAFQLGAGDDARRVVESTLDWALREMRLPGGGFASAQDADSEGEEGRYFVWTPAQLREALGADDADLAARVFGVSERGNFEGGATVLSLPHALRALAETLGVEEGTLRARTDAIRGRLLEVRHRRVAPGRDDKVLTAWNALMLGALAECGAALARPQWVTAACDCAGFLLSTLRRADGTLLRTWRNGGAKIEAFLEDHAFLADALLTLHAATGDERWVREASALVDTAIARFHEAGDGWYDTARDAAPLAVRPRTVDDNPIPAGQSTMARALLRLHGLTGEARLLALAEATVAPLGPAIARSPLGLASLAEALELLVRPMREIAVVGDPDDPDTRRLLQVVLGGFHPEAVLAWGGGAIPLLAHRPPLDGRPTAYVCQGFSCRAPVGDPELLRAQLAVPAGV
ncbi:MAG: thioredoxin domain-containing protein [Candidatus Dormibacteria bacterium]